MDIALRGTHKMGNHVLPARVGTVEHMGGDSGAHGHSRQEGSTCLGSTGKSPARKT